MKRGEVWWVDFDPSLGGEIRKQGPAIIVSNDASNRHLNRVQAVPLTSNVERLYPSEAYVSLGGAQRKAMADQLTTASKQRLIRKAGDLSSSDMQGVEQAIRVRWGSNRRLQDGMISISALLLISAPCGCVPRSANQPDG